MPQTQETPPPSPTWTAVFEDCEFFDREYHQAATDLSKAPMNPDTLVARNRAYEVLLRRANNLSSAEPAGEA